MFDGDANADRNQPVDAIAFFEKQYSVVKQQIDNRAQGYGQAMIKASDTLSEAYNLDDFIKTARLQFSIQTRA